MAADTLELKLPADLTAPRRARDAVRQQLEGLLPRPVTEDLVLVVSEMVSMVVRTAIDPTVDLRISWADVVRVEIHGGADEPLPDVGTHVILALLSARWGLASSPPAVWAELPIS